MPPNRSTIAATSSCAESSSERAASAATSSWEVIVIAARMLPARTPSLITATNPSYKVYGVSGDANDTQLAGAAVRRPRPRGLRRLVHRRLGPDGRRGGNIRLVAYSTPREAYAKLIELYRSGAGEGVSFHQSYGASGEQSRAVEAGLRADVVAFSLEPDMTRLVESGVVAQDWNAGEHKGMVTDSVVVFMVREGNPKGIKTWDDLTKDGVEVLTPNPFTSGGARWNVMAGYGAQLEQGESPEQAREYLRALFENVSCRTRAPASR